MQTSVVTIHPNALIADAAQMLEEFHIRRLPVVDDEGYLVGIITATDIREGEAASSNVSPYDPAAEEEWLAVGDIMTREVVTIGPGATIGEVAVLLMEHKIGGVPIVEQRANHLHMVGIVSETDIFRLIAAAWQRRDE
ncbi:MAG TPA: CBS domain-containing protein [Caldilineaceae bacterium]|nr:CBS domain-containing protein [Caldilineaceae bacterium]